MGTWIHTLTYTINCFTATWYVISLNIPSPNLESKFMYALVHVSNWYVILNYTWNCWSVLTSQHTILVANLTNIQWKINIPFNTNYYIWIQKWNKWSAKVIIQINNFHVQFLLVADQLTGQIWNKLSIW